MNRYQQAFLPILLALAMLRPLGAAQNSGGGNLAQLNLEDLLNVRVVSGSRHEQRQIESPRSMSVVTGDEIRRRNYRTIPDALNSLAGVMVQYTNYGGGAPIIRGLIGNRILILIDGIRINNAIYRLGPNQYLNTIDINRVERIEVVRGPGSVLYGSDALGGLINIITRKAETHGGSPEFRAGLQARLSSEDRGVSTRAQMEGGFRRWSMTGGVSLKRFGDLRSGGLVARQLNTGYDEAAGDAKLTYSISADREFTVSVEQLQQEDVRRTDVLAAGSDRRYDWSPQLRQMLVAQYKHGRVGRLIDGWQVAFTSQRHLEEVNRITASRPNTLRLNEDRVRTEGLAFQATSHWGERHLFTYGLDNYRDRVGSHREDLNLLLGTRTVEKSTYADGGRFSSLAEFVQDEIQINPALMLNLRARYSRFHVSGMTTDAATGTVSVHNDPAAITAGAYVSRRLRPGLFLVGGVGQGFRAPNLDDSTIVGSFSGGFEVPNPELRPEHAINYETGVKYQSNRVSGTASVFMSRFRNLIDRAPGFYQKLPFLDLNGNGRKDKGEDAVFQRMNVGRARIAGVELEGSLRLNQAWSAWANSSWIRGVDLNQHAPLTRIPPAKGETGVRWQTTSRKIWLEPWMFYAWRQTQLSTADLADRRIAAGGTPGFALAGLRAGVSLGDIGVLTVSLGNATNKAYRQHGSGIDGPGRGLVVGIARMF